MGPVPGGPGGAGGSHGGDTGAFDLFGAGCNGSSAGDPLRASCAGATGGSAAVGTGGGR